MFIVADLVSLKQPAMAYTRLRFSIMQYMPMPIFYIPDDKDRMMVGKTIMLPDVRWGGIKGVKSRTFINATLGRYN